MTVDDSRIIAVQGPQLRPEGVNLLCELLLLEFVDELAARIYHKLLMFFLEVGKKLHVGF